MQQRVNSMLNKRRLYLKWIAIGIAYICIFLLCYELGTNNRSVLNDGNTTPEPRHLLLKRLFYDHAEYLNSSVIFSMIEKQLKSRLSFDIENSIRENSTVHNGLVVFYDYDHHHVYFQQFLWLYSSWIQMKENPRVKNDLILFISSPVIPNDFLKLLNRTKALHKNEFLIYPCQTLVDSILDSNYQYLDNLLPNFHMELARLFYWQQTRLSSLLLFLHEEYRKKLLKYDFIFRLDIDSFLMQTFSLHRQRTSLILGQSIKYDQYTLNRLQRVGKYFHAKPNDLILEQLMTITWFGKLNLLTKLAQQVVLMTVWLMKVEFTESERLHHLTYLNYPSWYVDGILEYAAAVILLYHQYEDESLKRSPLFDCHHVLTNCLHVSLRDPSHHLNFSKHSLQLLTRIDSNNLTQNELYIYRTVIKSNGMFNLYFH